MKKILVILFVLFAITAHAQSQTGIAAVVNNDLITSSDVDSRIFLALHGANSKPDAKTLAAFKKQALDALIDEQIRLQEANRLNIPASKEEISEGFSKMAEQNNMKPEEFKKVLSSPPGVYESLMRQIETQIAWGKIVKQKVRPKVNVTEEDINSYLAEKAKNPAKVEYMIAEIFLRNTDSNQALAKQIVTDLRSGQKRFSVVARQFSQGLEASKGGLLGWIPENTLEAPIDSAIKATPVGKITDPVVSSRGLHILLVRERRDVLAADQASQRVHLKQVVVPLPPSDLPPQIMEKANAQAQFFQREAKDCKAMDEMIKKIHHPLSRDSGMMRLGDLPSPVVQAIKDLPENKATASIRAADGLAIFMVCGREADTDKMVRDDAANAIGTERLNRLQARYYRDLRSGAYVDIRQN